jgi:subtilisin family serine protease
VQENGEQLASRPFRQFRGLVASLLLLVSTAVVVSVAVPAGASSVPVPMLEAGEPTFRYIVVAATPADRVSLVESLRDAGVEIREEFTEVLAGIAASLSIDQYLALNSDRRVASISRDKVVSLESTLLAAPASESKDSDVIPGRYIVQTKPALPLSSRASILGIIGEGIRATYRFAISGYAAELSTAQVDQLRDHPDVTLVEPDRVVRVAGSQSNAPWGLDRIDQRDRPVNGTFNYAGTGSAVKAYVIDTGITLHSDFDGRLVSGFAASGLSSTNDGNGHGTHVAGTIGGTTWGVAKQATLVPVRVLDASGAGTVSGVISGINWVISDHKVGERAVANLSLGGSASSSMDTAIANLVNDGVVTVVAAGNDSTDACGSSPARAPSAITVGATTSSDVRSWFSNFGACLDIFAPGSSITSTWPTGGTATLSGTSMATPHVAGAVVAYWSQSENATKAASRIAADILDLASVDKVADPGTGSTNKLLYLPPASGSVPGVPSNVSAAEVGGAIEVTWSAPTNVATIPVTSYSAVSVDGSASCSSSSALTCTATGMPPGGYQFRVRATNEFGSSEFSAPSPTVTFVGTGNNDYFTGRTSLDPANVVVRASNIGATREVGEPSVNFSGTYRTLWYSYVPAADGALTIDLAGSSFDTVVGVYTGTSLSGLTKVAENDDEDLANGILSSKVALQVSAGSTYHLQLGSYWDTGGSIRMTTSFVARVAPNSPTNVIGTPGNARIIVSWSAPTVSPESVAEYVATATPGGKQCSVVAPNTGCVITSLTNGVAYSLSVVAKNSVGSSPAAASATTVTPSSGPTGSRQARTWGLDRIDQRATAPDGIYAPPADGADVVVYVVDTGVRASHQDFGGRVEGGISTVDGDASVNDCHGHGTHVASSAAGLSYGVASQATIVPVRVLDCYGSAYLSGVIAGLEWVATDAAARNLPAVVNMSLGGSVAPELDAATDFLVDRGIAVVVAAGNESDDACSVSPARTPRAITVGSSTADDGVSGFSNTGSCVDLFAPGSKIPGAGITTNLAEETMSGTSMASPHVAGYVAVVRGMFPGLSVDDLAQVVVESASSNVFTGLTAGTANRLLYVATSRCAIADLVDVNCTTGAKNVAVPVTETPVTTAPATSAPVVSSPTPAPSVSAPLEPTPPVVAPSVVALATGRARTVDVGREASRSAASAPRVTVPRDAPVALRVPGLPRRSQPIVNVTSRHGSVVLGKVKVTETGALRLPKLSFSKTGVYTFSFKVGKRTFFTKVSVVRSVRAKALSHRTVTVVQ